MPNFAEVTKMVIPEGEVVKIVSGSTVLWEKPSSGGGGTYSGTFSASSETEVVVVQSNSLGTSYTPKNVVVTRSGVDMTDGVISKVEDGVATFYDDNMGDFNTVGVDISPYRNVNGQVFGVTISCDEYTDNGEAIRFNGTYNWSFD